MADFTLIMIKALPNATYTPERIHNGQDGFGYISGLISLILVALIMPQMNGLYVDNIFANLQK